MKKNPAHRLIWLHVLAGWALLPHHAQAAHDTPVELHHRLSPPHAVALTLDACGGAYDRRLIQLLVQHRVPATLFVTQRWLQHNTAAVQDILQHGDLFEFENHGARHVPAVLDAMGAGPRKTLYGMKVHANEAALRAEIAEGAEAVRAATGRAPQYFRGAGAAYDSTGRATTLALGYRIAGFSVNADAGASYPANGVASRLRKVRPGDVVIAHMNHPASGTAEGFARALPELLRRGVVFVKLSESVLVPP